LAFGDASVQKAGEKFEMSAWLSPVLAGGYWKKVNLKTAEA
jgi:hypothetical protein